MPKIYEYFGIIFLFYANDHLPIHVHAQSHECENKFEFEFENGKLKSLKIKPVKGKLPLPETKKRDAEIFVRKYCKEIAEKWTDFFVLRKKVKNKKINRKIK